MPPRNPSSAPPGRVYKSLQPPQQLRFPERRRSVRGYGNVGGKKVPEMRLRKQETLTQMDFLRLGGGAGEEVELEELELEGFMDGKKIANGEGRQEGERGINEMTTRRGTRRRSILDDTEMLNTKTEDDGSLGGCVETSKASTTRKAKRRRTMGDLPSEDDTEGDRKGKKPKVSTSSRRKTVGDRPSRSKTQQYHTQTITQLDWAMIPSRETDEEELDEDEKSFDSTIFDVPSSSQAVPPKRFTRAGKEASKSMAVSGNSEETIPKEMPPPQTPKRAIPREIPSSESPATPVFLRSGTSQPRTPLRQTSPNTPIPFIPNSILKPSISPSKLPRLVVRDTFDTATDISQMTRLPSTPLKKSSPPKSVRFAISGEMDLSSPLQELPVKRIAFAKSEILDSDAESDEQDLENGEEKAVDDIPQGISEQETCYGDIGLETLFEAERLVSSAGASQLGNSQPNDTIPSARRRRHFVGSPTLTQPTGSPHQDSQLDRHVEDEQDDYHGQFGDKTQFRESQRLQTQHRTSLAPRTLTSDIFVSLPSQQVTDIVSRKRTCDIHAFPYPAGVSRIWIYVLKPVLRLTYMAALGDAKRPGELTDEEGLGNRVFNKKERTSNWRAYEIEELYELADPLSLEQLIENEWLHEPPKKYEFVRPAVIDSLIANLMPPLFDRLSRQEEEEEEEGEEEEVEVDVVDESQQEESQQQTSSSANDTQEATAQLLSTIHQYTQHDLSFPHPVPTQHSSTNNEPADRYGNANIKQEEDADEEEEIIPSSQNDVMLPPPATSKPSSPTIHWQPALSQASTVDLTQTQHPHSATTPSRKHHSSSHLRSLPSSHPDDVVWESPSRPVRSSSPTTRVPSSHSLPHSQSQLRGSQWNGGGVVTSGNRGGGISDEGDSSSSSIVVPFSISSSQMLTRSQMDREVVGDSIPPPPLSMMGFVGNSDDEEEDEL